MSTFIKGFTIGHGLATSWIFGTDAEGKILEVLAYFIGDERRAMCEAAADVLRKRSIAQLEAMTDPAPTPTDRRRP